MLPDVVSYSTAIAACGIGGQWQHALVLCERSPLNPVVFGASISACDSAGRWQHALMLLEDERVKAGDRTPPRI
eukprot:symbB.v1.2.009128.t1/scaffold577.1/size258142/3